MEHTLCVCAKTGYKSRPLNPCNLFMKYVVDYYEYFVYGMPLNEIVIPGYKSTGIAKDTHTQCVFHIIRLRLIIFHTPKYFHGRNKIE